MQNNILGWTKSLNKKVAKSVLKMMTIFHCKGFQNYCSPEELLMYVDGAEQSLRSKITRNYKSPCCLPRCYWVETADLLNLKINTEICLGFACAIYSTNCISLIMIDIIDVWTLCWINSVNFTDNTKLLFVLLHIIIVWIRLLQDEWIYTIILNDFKGLEPQLKIRLPDMSL